MKQHFYTFLFVLVLAMTSGERADALLSTTIKIITWTCTKTNVCTKLELPVDRPNFISRLARLTNSPDALSEDEIIKFAQMIDEPKGLDKVGKILGQRELDKTVLEDFWMRVAIHKERISRSNAVRMYERLSGVPGFRATLRKICGNNPNGTKGHLNELNIARFADEYGIKVREIGLKFKDPGKSGQTDIDVVLELGGKTFAIETKDFSINPLPMDKFRADMDSLVAFKKSSGTGMTIPVFSITQAPPTQYKLLLDAARRRDIQLLVGSPEVQVREILHLSEIM